MPVSLDRFAPDFWSKRVELPGLEEKLVGAGASTDEARQVAEGLGALDTNPNDGRLAGGREIGALLGHINANPSLFLEPRTNGKPVYDLLSLLATPDPTVAPEERLAWVRELPPRERFGLHGMFIVGSGGDFTISHIPMHAQDPHHHHHHGDETPHNLQALWKVRLTRSTLPSETSLAAGEFTFRPDRQFHLNDLLRGDIRAVGGTIHQGNFEHGGPVIGRATLAVDALLTAQILPEADAVDATLGYFAFGTPEATYLCHRIEGRPDFYQLLRVELEPNEHWSPEALAKGELAIQVPGRSNDVESRLVAGDEVTAIVEPRGPVKLKVLEQIAALHGPDFVEPVR